MPSITTRRSTHAAERRAEIQARILAAVERSLEGGERFTDLSVQRIVETAGIASSTFYVHFRDKSDVLLSLAAKLKDTSFNRVTVWDPDGTDPFPAMVEILTGVIAVYREHAALLRAVLEVAAYDEAVRQMWNDELERQVALGRRWLEAAQRDGMTSAGVRTDTAVRVLVHGGIQAITHHIATGDPADDAAVAREIAEIQWFGALRRPDHRD
ncbi:TetR/AcrR family transcriptional regulator [Actinoplanes sp. TBRC 11911]|uniref:TetR/AcrR family transcriptional regulator n=1 Tax=Actinoplanes sp. TBRC 11911 TaxID=2729386 RepID=UPI00145CBEAD|nr:TetR/AcrR family transcriptional regulator [Actinoplanes sp. TBRC 11911]NMO55891.1 TetR/AcrR family transcriptional regulator [Actinoplanes sp. TBRC 11911]